MAAVEVGRVALIAGGTAGVGWRSLNDLPPSDENP
jgi:hypothetical protein